jgi:hypothetical protein
MLIYVHSKEREEIMRTKIEIYGPHRTQHRRIKEEVHESD